MGHAKLATDVPGTPIAEALSGRSIFFGRPLRVVGGAWEASPDRLLSLWPRGHLLTVAPTRAGKGVAQIIPNLLIYQQSMVVIDPKGENAWITAQHRKKDTWPVILDPWGEVQRRYGNDANVTVETVRFNPLSILDPASPNYADDLAYIADALIIDQGKDPHWPDSARELVAGLIAFIIEKPELRPNASLGLVRQLLCGSAAEIRAMAEDAAALGPESVAARKLGRFAGDGGRETDSILSTARTQTAFLDSVTLQANMAASDFSFERLTEYRTMVYLVLPADKLQTYGRWLRLLISIAIRTVGRTARPGYKPVLFMLDEFGTIGRLNAVSQAYGLMAGLGMKIWAFVQDLNQLKRDYPDEWETFIANSSKIILFGAMDQFTCEYFSRMAGTKTVERLSTETNVKRADTWLSKGNPNASSLEDHVISQPLARPESIRCMAENRCLIFGPHDPIFAELVPFYTEPTLAAMARAEPHRAQDAATEDERLRVLDEPNAARQALELGGYKIRKHAMGTGYNVTPPGEAARSLNSEAALVAYAKQQLRGRPIMVKG
jgi:type IV secretion system protein VirD4